jgi:hypothetical protein
MTAFMAVAVLLSLLVFIGEAVRDAFDPRKLFAGEVPAEEVGLGPERGDEEREGVTATGQPACAKAVGESD